MSDPGSGPKVKTKGIRNEGGLLPHAHHYHRGGYALRRSTTKLSATARMIRMPRMMFCQ